MSNGIFSDHHHDVSEIQNYFTGKNVFLTGVTGSLGKLVVEKLLRTCNVTKIFVHAREKKGKAPNERLKEILDVPAFEPLKKQMPNFADKIQLCTGDCLEPDLGLSQEDIDLLKDEVNCIVHCAATVRFDASLRKATYINVRAVMDLIKMAKDMKQLTSFIHVSTAYSHCPREDIDEEIYEPPIKGQNLLKLVEALNDDVLDAITPTLLGQWPNTYVFTKAVAEDVVKSEGKGLPMSILKPSIILSAWKEPVPGWIDNIYGPSGIALATALGLIRTLHFDTSKRTDLVPSDYVVNAILAAAWDVGERTVLDSREADRKDPTVYNCVSGSQKPLTWSSYISLTKKSALKLPSPLVMWHYVLFVNSNLYIYYLCDFFFHTIPAYFVDFICLCIGKKPMLVDGYKKIRKLLNVSDYFRMRDWNFKDTNVQNLWNKLSARDQELFEFDIKKIDWDTFFDLYTLGIRLYILKDPLDTLPQGARKVLILKFAHYTLLTVLTFLLYLLFKFLFKLCFQ